MRRTLRLIRQDVAPEKKLIGAGVVALLCEVCFRVLEPWPLKIVVDALSVSLGAKVDELSATPALLLTCGGALLAIVGARALSNYLATVAFSLVGSRAATSLRSRVFSHVQRLSQQFHSRNRSADTVQRVVSDVARMQEVAVTAGLPLLANMITLLVMLVAVLRRYRQQSSDPSFLSQLEDPRLSGLLQAVLLAPQEDWSIARMAEMAKLSRAQLMRLFKSVIGESPHRFVLSIRLQQAAVQLAASADTILRIALENGFVSESHFNRAFKQYFGQTPKQYRVQQLEEAEKAVV